MSLSGSDQPAILQAEMLEAEFEAESPQPVFTISLKNSGGPESETTTETPFDQEILDQVHDYDAVGIDEVEVKGQVIVNHPEDALTGDHQRVNSSRSDTIIQSDEASIEIRGPPPSSATFSVASTAASAGSLLNEVRVVSVPNLKIHFLDVNNVLSIQIIDGSNNISGLLFDQSLSEIESVVVEGAEGDDVLAIDFGFGVDYDAFPDTFSGVTFNSGSGDDSLLGPFENSTWRVTGAGSGTLSDLVVFTGVENLAGAIGNEDTFVLAEGGSLSGLFDGGASGFDSLVIEGGSYSNAAYTATGPDSGIIDLDGKIIKYAGLEPITDSSTTAARSYSIATPIPVGPVASSGDDIIRLRDHPDAGRMIIESVNGTFESVTFNNPSTSLTISSGTGNDNIMVMQLDPGFTGTLIVNGEAGDDSIILDLDFNLRPGLTFDGGADSDTIRFERYANVTLTNTALTFGTPGTDPFATLVSIEKALGSANAINADAFSGKVTFMSGVPAWTGQGPDIINNIPVDIWDPVTGAIQAIAVHPDYPDNKTIYTGTVNGGVWRATTLTVLFDTAEFTLDSGDTTILNNLVYYLRQNPGLTVHMAGHTDSVGESGDNVTLSQNRVNSVYNHLIAQGIAADRITGAHYSETHPIADNSTDAGKALNRRVDITYWEPLTDEFPSLSISSIAISPINSNRIFAGIGITSSAIGLGGHENGILYSADAGNSWILLGKDRFNGLKITDVLPTPIVAAGGQVVFVSTLDVDRDNNDLLDNRGGVFLGEVAPDGSTSTFVKISGDGSSGLPVGHYTDLAMDPGGSGRPLRLFAANPDSGIYQWTQPPAGDGLWHEVNTGFQFGTDTDTNGEDDLLQEASRIKFAIHPSSGILYAAVLGPVNDFGLFNLTGSKSGLIGLFRRTGSGDPWTPLAVPTSVDAGITYGLHPGRQGDIHFSITVDPTNADIIYLGGDRQPVIRATVDYAAGTNPSSVFDSDLDGDGDIDLAVANEASNNVSIFINNGNGTYAAAVNYPAGTPPRSVTAANLDGDGDTDLAISNFGGNNVSILMNNGAGVFAAAVNYGAGTGPVSVSASNLDGDGDVDLAVANFSSNDISILMNNGDGTFDAAVNYAAGTGPMSVFAANLDGDGDADLAAANHGSNNVSILKNNGAGTFSAAVNFASGTSSFSVYSRDIRLQSIKYV